MTVGVDLLPWLLCIFTAVSVFWLYAVLFGPEPADVIGSPGHLGTQREFKGIFLKVFGNVIVVLGSLISTLPLGARREHLRKQLISAGNPGGLSVDEYYATRFVAMVLAVFAGLFIDNEIESFPMITFGLVALGFFYPNIWIKGVIQQRRRRIFRDLPDILDTLRLAVDAGLDLNSALKVVAEKGRRGPLMDELERVEKDVTLGRTRKEAFRGFADRIGMSEINAFVIALMQADQLGSSVGPILKVQAEMARTRRWQLAEALVNKMPMKMLGPLVVFIFPASFIILFTPLIIQWMQSE